jgi:hypothetical protein
MPAIIAPDIPHDCADFAVRRRLELAAYAAREGDPVEALRHASNALRYAARVPLDCLSAQRIADVVVTLEQEVAARLSPPSDDPPPTPSTPAPPPCAA